MALTIKDIELIKEALQPAFDMLNGRMDRLEHKMDLVESQLNKRIDLVEIQLNKKIELVETRLSKRIDLIEIRLEQRIELSEKNIIEISGDLHADLENRVRKLEKPIQTS